MSKLAMLAFAAAAPLPWRLRRMVLKAACGFVIHKTAFISRFALVMPSRLEMGPNSHIGALTFCKGAELLRIEEYGFIGPLNWITAFPLGTGGRHFELDPERKPHLIVERHAAITDRHIHRLHRRSEDWSVHYIRRVPLADTHPQHRPEPVAPTVQARAHWPPLLCGNGLCAAGRKLPAGLLRAWRAFLVSFTPRDFRLFLRRSTGETHQADRPGGKILLAYCRICAVNLL